ncbi:MAG: hypothetical protein AAF628_34005 [Planctomycetota bacterium]
MTNEPSGKFGAGHAAAMGRLGLSELRNIFVMSDSNVAQQHAEYGLYGTATPGEISEARRPDDYDHGEERGSVLEQQLEQAMSRDDMEPADKSMERE